MVKKANRYTILLCEGSTVNTIYGLCDPLTADFYRRMSQDNIGLEKKYRNAIYSPYKRIRYIGVTDDIYRRYWEHVNRSGNERKGDWVKVNRERQTMIELYPLQYVAEKKPSLIRETYWISYYHFVGADLFNLSKYHNGLPGRDRILYAAGKDTKHFTWELLELRWLIAFCRHDESLFVRSLVGQNEDTHVEAIEMALKRRSSLLSWKETFTRQAELTVKELRETGGTYNAVLAFYGETYATYQLKQNSSVGRDL